MTFFNKKEEVIEIKLTQFGKNLLSRGGFKPAYYRFFDDDIIYDLKYAGSVEDQNSAEDRIKDAIRIRTQHVNKGVETRFDEETKDIESGQKKLFQELKLNQTPEDKEGVLQSPLCHYNVNSEYTPYFKLSMLGASFSDYGSVKYLTSSGIQAKVPQFESEPSYKILNDKTEAITNPQELEEHLRTFDSVDTEFYRDLMPEEGKINFFDNSSIDIHTEDLIIDLQEFNVPYSRENFKIEIFEMIETEVEDPDGTKRIEEVPVQIIDNQEIAELFHIRVDESVRGIDLEKLSKHGRAKSFFSK